MSKRHNHQVRVQVNDHAYYTHAVLQSHLLETDLHYQRKIDVNRVNKIVSEFDKGKVRDLWVSHRDGKYYVFDGGHTLTALKLLNADKKSFPVFCRLYEHLTYEEECYYFATQRDNVKPVAAVELLKANIEGKDPEILKFVAISEAAGIPLAVGEHKGPQIRAVDKAWNVYTKYGEQEYTETLALIKDTWNGNQSSLVANMIGGVASFVHAFAGMYDRSRFIDRLKNVKPKGIQQMAHLNKAVYQCMDAAFATEIARIYNHGRGKGRLDNIVVSE